MENKIKNWLRNWLGLGSVGHRIATIEHLIYHEESSLNGFAVLKKHLNRPDKPLPRFGGKEIEQD